MGITQMVKSSAGAPEIVGRLSSSTMEADTTVAATGTNNIDSTVVPAGEIWVLTGYKARNNTSSTSDEVFLMIYNGTTANDIERAVASAVASTPYYMVGNPVYLKEGDYARLSYEGCTVSDSLKTNWFFTKYKI